MCMVSLGKYNFLADLINVYRTCKSVVCIGTHLLTCTIKCHACAKQNVSNKVHKGLQRAACVAVIISFNCTVLWYLN